MGKPNKERQLQQRIKDGKVSRQDVVRRLGELAFGRVNDCVRLVLEEEPELETLDLSLLSEVKKSGNGTVEVKLIDRLQVLKQLAQAAQEQPGEMGAFLQALQGGEP